MYKEAIDSARVHLIKDVPVVQGRKGLSMIGSHVSAVIKTIVDGVVLT